MPCRCCRQRDLLGACHAQPRCRRAFVPPRCPGVMYGARDGDCGKLGVLHSLPKCWTCRSPVTRQRSLTINGALLYHVMVVIVAWRIRVRRSRVQSLRVPSFLLFKVPSSPEHPLRKQAVNQSSKQSISVYIYICICIHTFHMCVYIYICVCVCIFAYVCSMCVSL